MSGMSGRWNTRTIGELREMIADLDDNTPILWAYDSPEECCDGHAHDITEIWDCDAYIDAATSGLTVMLKGGTP